MLAICIAGLIGCSDDGKDKLADGAIVDEDGGRANTLDGSIDSSLPGRDATLSADGAIIEAPDGSSPESGKDATVSLPCGGSCNDNVDCTVDTCIDNKCEHRIDNNVCMPGFSCSLTAGCQQGQPCGADAECADTQACTTNERCDPMTRRCEHDVLDGDGDGYPPVSCGGADCDDSRGLVSPSGTEVCNGRDDDCDGTVDDHITPVAGYVCTNGQTACAPGYELCNGFCVDTKTNPLACGGCGARFVCAAGEECVMGACKCDAGGSVMMCGAGAFASCSDTSKSELNCGMCGHTCGAGGMLETCIASSCTACGSENDVCCDSFGTLTDGCFGGFTCEGTPGAAGSKCVCGAGSTKCGQDCVDLATDSQNCGACGKVCQAGSACVTSAGVSACKPCGGLGQACCDTLAPCRAGRVCGADNTCVAVGAP